MKVWGKQNKSQEFQKTGFYNANKTYHLYKGNIRRSIINYNNALCSRIHTKKYK